MDNVLCLDDPEIIHLIPDRPNVALQLVEVPENYERELTWVADVLKDNAQNIKCVVYVRTITTCFKLYKWLKTYLGKAAYSGEEIRDNLILDMVHSSTPQDAKDKLMADFPKKDSKVRLIVATIAFGMGVNIPDIDIVVHWGLPGTLLLYWQESGRAGRDGRQALSVCYAFKKSITTCNEASFKDIVTKHTTGCLRKLVLENFVINGVGKEDIEQLSSRKCCTGCDGPCQCCLCLCCCRCHEQCTCENKGGDLV